MKFDYNIYEAADGLYGTINDNEEWNGMIGDLVNSVHFFQTKLFYKVTTRRKPISRWAPYR